MLPIDAASLYDWTPGSKQPYADFLRAKLQENPIRFAIDSRYKDLIATNPQLAEHGITVVSLSPERGFTLLSQDIRQTAEPGPAAGEENAAAFHWGFSEFLMSQGQLNIALDELIKLTKNPAHAWACQQFELARDEFRRQLYREALQSVTRGLEGQGSNEGNQAEFRLHFLAGIIRLGSYRNVAPDLVKPRLAQQDFLTAARHAEPACAAEAGLALICAGRAALVAGEIEDAIAHTRKGLSLVPSHAAGMYQLGRVLHLKGARSEAADRLADASLLDVEQALHAAGDADLIANGDFLNGALRQAHERQEARYRQSAERYRRALQTLHDYAFMEVSAASLPLQGLGEIQQVPKAAEALAEPKTLFGYAAATKHVLGGFRLLPACFEDFKAHCIRQLRQKITQPPRREDYLPANASVDAQGGRGSSKAGLASGIISGLAIFLFESAQMARPIYRGLLESMSELFLIPLVSAFGIAVAVAVGEDLYREYLRSKYKSALAAFEAASYNYRSLKNSLEGQIASIQGMDLPREFAPPASGAVAPSHQPEGKKRASAWTKL